MNDEHRRYKIRADDLDRLIGKNLKAFRRRRKISQSDLAECLNVSFQQIQKYERGENRLSFAAIIRICETYGEPIMSFEKDIIDVEEYEAFLHFKKLFRTIK